MQLLERRSPDAGELEAAVDEQRAELASIARQRAEQTWLAERRTQLQADGRIEIDATVLGQ